MTSSDISQTNPHGGANPILAITALLSVLFVGLVICLAIETPMSTWPTWTIQMFGAVALGIVVTCGFLLNTEIEKIESLFSETDGVRVFLTLVALVCFCIFMGAVLCHLLGQHWLVATGYWIVLGCVILGLLFDLCEFDPIVNTLGWLASLLLAVLVMSGFVGL